MKPTIFERIIIPVPKGLIYRRLGYREGVTGISSLQKKQIEKYIEDAVSLIHLKGTGLAMPIKRKNIGATILSDGTILKSKSLALLFKGASQVLLMAATSGSKITNAIKRDSRGKDVTRAVVFDAAASEMTDAALGWIMEYFSRELRRQDKYLTKRRFSAGYADFVLENQKVIYKLLDLKRMGIKITKSCILVPEKSVTAVAGVISAYGGCH
jgi:hypothetical protein